jgi:threonine aldolase
LLAGSNAFIEEARYKRQIMGGGMRQAGILAAAGLIALGEHTSRLAEDHARARKLEKALAEIPGINTEQGDINMVFFRWKAKKDLSREITEAYRSRGIIISAPEKKISGGETEHLFRFVIHYWIGDKELETIIEASRSIFAESRQ